MKERESPRMAYLVSRYPGLSHTFILREVRELRRLGFAIWVASINDPDREAGALTEEERQEAAATYYVKRHGLAGALRAHLSAILRAPLPYGRAAWYAARLGGGSLADIGRHCLYFVEAAMVTRWMRLRRLTHLHVHFATPAATVGLIATRLAPITLSLTVHGPDEFYDVTRYRLREKIAGAAFLCTIGSFARSQLMKLAPVSEWRKFEIAPLGVDPEVFAPAPHACGEPCEVLCVGRLVAAKGQHILLAAARRLQQQSKRVVFRLVGDGPDRASLQEEVRRHGLEECFRLEGPVNQDRIGDFYRRADIFVLPSFAEGIPVVLMEAMAMEIPCITTYVAGIPELIRNDVDGILVPPSDEEALAAAIVRLMEDAALRRRLGCAGRERVRQNYDLARNTGRLADVFRRRLEGLA